MILLTLSHCPGPNQGRSRLQRPPLNLKIGVKIDIAILWVFTVQYISPPLVFPHKLGYIQISYILELQLHRIFFDWDQCLKHHSKTTSLKSYLFGGGISKLAASNVKVCLPQKYHRPTVRREGNSSHLCRQPSLRILPQLPHEKLCCHLYNNTATQPLSTSTTALPNVYTGTKTLSNHFLTFFIPTNCTCTVYSVY